MKAFFTKLIEARKAKASYIDAAKQLHVSEYKNEDFDYVLSLVSKGLIGSVTP